MEKIKFNNGRLRVLQVSDLQDTVGTSVDTLRFVGSAIEKYKPDLIVMTGDQLDVAGLWGLGDRRKNVEKAIRRLFSVFEKSGVPYALTFGNHDCQTGVPNEEQAKIYSTLKGCVGFENMRDGRPDAGTFNIPVYSSDGEKTVLNFYLMDTFSQKKDAFFVGVNAAQLEWYRQTSESLKSKNGGEPVKSVVFQHIPVYEIYRLMLPAEKNTAAEPAFKDKQGRLWKLNTELLSENTAFGETPSTQAPENPQFSAVKEQGDVFAMFFGHDHYNSFLGSVDGIDLGYCPGSGYSSYGLKRRAMRVFDFDENDVAAYSTYTVDYDDCCEKSETAPVKNFLSCRAPSCPETAGPFAVKCAAGLFAAAAVLLILYFFVSSYFVKVLLLSSAAAGVVYAVVSTIYNAYLRKKLISRRDRHE